MKKRKFLFIWVLALSLVLVFNFVLTKNAKNSELSLLGLSTNIAHAQSECPDDEENNPVSCSVVCEDLTTAEGSRNYCFTGNIDCTPTYCDAECPPPPPDDPPV